MHPGTPGLALLLLRQRQVRWGLCLPTVWRAHVGWEA